MNEVVLRRWFMQDKKELQSLADNRRIFDNVRDHFPSPYSLNDAERFIRKTIHEDPPLSFAIIFKDQLAGAIGLKKQDDVYSHSAEIGYWIGEPFWGKGIATCAVELMTEYGFRELKLKRIFARVYGSNLSSRRLLEKNGYELEGIFKKGALKNGKLLDEYCFARLKED